jgi:pimeloyl-ACP methyl ester carboxylesterase
MTSSKRPSSDLPVYVTEDIRQGLMSIYDERLATWPAPFDTVDVATGYGKTRVLRCGDPSLAPLVMTHPMGVGSFVWSSIIEPLSHHRRIYAIDTIGDVGKSVLDDPSRYPKTGADYSRWLDDVYRALFLESADSVGASMGGWIAMNHAIYAPRTVRRLVLLAPMGIAPWRSTLAVLGPFMSQRLRPRDDKLERIISRSLGPGDRVNQEFRPWMRIMGYTKALVGQPFHIPARRLRKIDAPTLALLGGRDGLVGRPNAAARRAHAFIAHAEVAVLPDAGHIMSVDEPDVVASRILDFLK